MSVPKVNNVKIYIKDLPTKVVTFSPQSAHVVREVRDIKTEPGINEILIYGLDQSIDPDSIRVDGKGPAAITDINTERVRHEEDFDIAYPQETDDDIESEEEQEKDYGIDYTEEKKLKADYKDLQDRRGRACHLRDAAKFRLRVMEEWGTSLPQHKETDASKIGDWLKISQNEALEQWKETEDNDRTIQEIDRQIKKVEEFLSKVTAKNERLKYKASKADRHALQVKIKAQAQKREEKNKIRNELLKFWPSYVSQIKLTLDGFRPDEFTPLSSRRSSVTIQVPDLKQKGMPDPEPEEPEERTGMTVLTISYVTRSASWTPKYEMTLKTGPKSAKLVCLAEFKNSSSETWKDTKVILSTSQTSFAGLNEKVPKLTQWSVRLQDPEQWKYRSQSSNLFGNTANVQQMPSADKSMRKKEATPFGGFGATQARGGGLFGSAAPAGNLSQAPGQSPFSQPQAQSSSLFALARPHTPVAPPASLFAFGSQDASGLARGEFRRESQAPSSSRPFNADAQAAYQEGLAESQEEREVSAVDMSDEEMGFGLFDGEAAPPPSKPLQFEQSQLTSTGLTTNHNLPGQRNIPPSSQPRRHHLITIELTDISFAHTAVPRVKPVAYLTARLRNPAEKGVTILPGPAGLTLDGSFLGTSSLSRCSPGTCMDLPLGIDPSVQISYGKPVIKRSNVSTGGLNLFNTNKGKDENILYSRTCWINNTKHNAVAELKVLDQIPVSEDETLKVTTLTPAGLNTERAIPAGESAKESTPTNSKARTGSVDTSASSSASAQDAKKKEWGKGTVKLDKEGLVSWDLKINPSKGCKIALEYAVKVPSGKKADGLENGGKVSLFQ